MATTSSAFRQLSDGNTVGTCLGIGSTDTIAFYGGATNNGTTFTGAIQTTIVGGNYATSIVPAINATTASVTAWAFASSTQANALIGLLDWAYRAGIIR